MDTHTLDSIGREPEPSSQVAVSADLRRSLVIAEHGAEWAALADDWRQRGHQVSILLQHAGEPEPAFVRRLCVVVARAQVDDQPFESVAVIVSRRCDPLAEAARTRLLQLLAQCLLRAAQPVVLRIECPVAPSTALCQGLERLQRTLAREFHASFDGPALALCIAG